MPSSRIILDGEDYTPDDINNLRNDVLDSASGHKHSGTDSAKIQFSALDVVGASGGLAPTGGSKSYAQMTSHVSASAGAHGLNASVHALGGGAAGAFVQSGEATLSGTSKVITFPIAFASTPVVVATMYSEPGSSALTYDEQGPWITSRSASGFTMNVRFAWNDAMFGWIAVGTKT